MHMIPGQVGIQDEDIVRTWANVTAQKASELLKAAQNTSVAVETAIGALLAATDGWPRWARAEVSSQPGRPPAQQLALVTALSHRLGFAAILQSGAVRYESPCLCCMTAPCGGCSRILCPQAVVGSRDSLLSTDKQST